MCRTYRDTDDPRYACPCDGTPEPTKNRSAWAFLETVTPDTTEQLEDCLACWEPRIKDPNEHIVCDCVFEEHSHCWAGLPDVPGPEEEP